MTDADPFGTRRVDRAVARTGHIVRQRRRAPARAERLEQTKDVPILFPSGSQGEAGYA